MDKIPHTTRSDLPLVGWPMSLCWCSNTEKSNKASLNVRLLLALGTFPFEDIPRRCAGLLSILAIAGAAWLLWLDYLCCIRHF